MPIRLGTLRLYYFVTFSVLGMYLPFFPRWLEGRGIQGVAMGMVAATLPAMGLLAPPVFGLIADALRVRGSLLRAACAGAFLSFGSIAGFAAAGRPMTFWALLIAMSAFAFFRSPMVMIADVVTLEAAPDSGKRYGGIRLFGSLGFLIAAMVAGWLFDPSALLPLPIAITACLFAAFAVSLLFPLHATQLSPGQRRTPEGMRGLVREGSFRVFLASAFLWQAAHSAYDLCFSLHLRDLGISESLVGIAWAFGVAAEIVLMAKMEFFFARAGPAELLALAFAGAAARWVLLAVVRNPVALMALQPLHAISFSLMWVSSLAYTRERAPAQALATAQGLLGASIAAGSVVGMLCWGPLYRRAGGAWTFGTAAIVSAAAFGCAVVLRRLLRAEPRWREAANELPL